MISNVPFQTKARTVDHLGREQIADTPTAISELWKNAFDAYAREVALDLFDGKQPVAVIHDDGHGMSRDEFISRWLVVGTESKAATDKTLASDRNGLPPRPRQGQKGIGRLSCANLGPVLLLVSKRKDSPYVAALVDWRLFENPFLNLSDIHIPVVEFEKRSELFDLIPGLADGLATNLVDRNDKDRSARLAAAWDAFDRLYKEELKGQRETRLFAPSSEIRESIEGLYFRPDQLSKWPVWTGEASHGTALLVADINFDLRAHLSAGRDGPAALDARRRLFETLSSFVDPFVAEDDYELNAVDPEFHYQVRAWNGQSHEVVVSKEKQFDRRQLDGMEHVLVGRLGEDGVFKGRVKAFGQWVEGECKIAAPSDLSVPTRADTKLGPIDLYIASMEFQRGSTTLSDVDFNLFRDLAEKYAGFMVFRDGLRVLPFGRTDSDFFEIEMRRSQKAGREFWNHRQMFGRLAIRRASNPNLRDKAGREGLIDNRAAKTLRHLISNILMTSARLYFGSDSSLRADTLPGIKEANKADRAREARNAKRRKDRKLFNRRLKNRLDEVPDLLDSLEVFSTDLNVKNEDDISEAQNRFENLKDEFNELRLPGAPKALGALEQKYADYQGAMRQAQALIESIGESLTVQIEAVAPMQPRQLLEQQLSRHSNQLGRRVGKWKKKIDTLQRAEYDRIKSLVEDRKRHYYSEAQPLLARFDRGEMSYAEASSLLELEKARIDAENEQIFQPYIGALESLAESIDLEHLASFGAEEVGELREQLDRLNGLAQLGIAVEITGHELQSFDDIIGDGLRRLPESVRDTKPVEDIRLGYEGLTDQLRFLSPLRLSGQKVQRWIDGNEIADYVQDFFQVQLARHNIEFEATRAFRSLRVYDQRSRLFPVFINLANNSLYWVTASETDDRRILLDVREKEVLVCDSGPGVEPGDIENLFSLFFTRKTRGGRGVGLYLSRSNLAAGGHKIRYLEPSGDLPLSGATFAIELSGAEFDDR